MSRYLEGITCFAVTEVMPDETFYLKKSERDGCLALFEEKSEATLQIIRNNIPDNDIREVVVVRKASLKKTNDYIDLLEANIIKVTKQLEKLEKKVK